LTVVLDTHCIQSGPAGLLAARWPRGMPKEFRPANPAAEDDHNKGERKDD